MWTSAKDWSRVRGRGVKSVRMTIYVARLLETSQEQFITDIRAVLGSQNFIMTRKTLSTTEGNRFPSSITGWLDRT